MSLPPLQSDLLIAALYGGILLLVAVKQYLEQRKNTRAASQPAAAATTVAAAFGAGLGEREQMERLIEQVKRIADALTDRNIATIDNRLEQLAASFDSLRREQERQGKDLMGMRTGRSRSR